MLTCSGMVVNGEERVRDENWQGLLPFFLCAKTLLWSIILSIRLVSVNVIYLNLKYVRVIAGVPKHAGLRTVPPRNGGVPL